MKPNNTTPDLFVGSNANMFRNSRAILSKEAKDAMTTWAKIDQYLREVQGVDMVSLITAMLLEEAKAAKPRIYVRERLLSQLCSQMSYRIREEYYEFSAQGR